MAASDIYTNMPLPTHTRVELDLFCERSEPRGKVARKLADKAAVDAVRRALNFFCYGGEVAS